MHRRAEYDLYKDTVLILFTLVDYNCVIIQDLLECDLNH